MIPFFQYPGFYGYSNHNHLKEFSSFFSTSSTTLSYTSTFLNYTSSTRKYSVSYFYSDLIKKIFIVRLARQKIDFGLAHILATHKKPNSTDLKRCLLSTLKEQWKYTRNKQQTQLNFPPKMKTYMWVFFSHEQQDRIAKKRPQILKLLLYSTDNENTRVAMSFWDTES